MTHSRRKLFDILAPLIGLLLITSVQWLPQSYGPLRDAITGVLVCLSAFICLGMLFALNEVRRCTNILNQFKRAMKRRDTELKRLRARIETESDHRNSPRRLTPEEGERRVAQFQRLQRQVEILSSMRALSLIANDEADLNEVLTRSFDIVQRLFDATEIQIFSCENKAEDSLLLRAVRKQKRTSFASVEDPMRFKGARKEALKAIAERRNFMKFTGQRLCVVSQLMANQEPIGVIVVYIPHRQRTDQWAGNVLSELVDLTKHVALVINKPTLYDKAVLDALTGLYSKRHFLDQVPKAMSSANRNDQNLSMIVIDIDHFKSINDTYGHVSGDIVLAATAKSIKDSIRDYDSAYRFGGEEMCIVSPSTDLESALKLADRIRVNLENAVILGDQGQEIRITASFGVAVCTQDMTTLDAFVASADAWLYKAKEEGRNQVRPFISEVLSPATKVSAKEDNQASEEQVQEEQTQEEQAPEAKNATPSQQRARTERVTRPNSRRRRRSVSQESSGRRTRTAKVTRSRRRRRSQRDPSESVSV